MKPTNLDLAKSATTLEQVRSAEAMGVSWWMLQEHSPYYQMKAEEYRELVRLAAPLYRELHSTLPYYADRPNDDPFWSAYVSSRIVDARRRVAAYLKSTTSADSSPPEQDGP